jgi:hypothetical protein
VPEGATRQVSRQGDYPPDARQWIEVEKIWSMNHIVDAAIAKHQAPITK